MIKLMNRRAVTKVQAAVLAVVIIVVAVAGVLLYSNVFVTTPSNIKIAKIGWMGDFTSVCASYSIPGKAAAQMAVDYVNDVLYPNGLQVGNDKYKFQLVVEDTQLKVEDYPIVVKKLIGEGVFIIMTDFGQFDAPAFSDIEKAGVPIFVWLNPSSAEEEMLDNPWFFRYRNTAMQAIPGLGYYMVKTGNLGVSKVSTFTESSPAGEVYREQFSGAFEKYGASTVSHQEFPGSQTDFNSYLTNAIAAGTDCILSGTTIPTCQMYMQAKALGYTGYWGSFTGLTEVQAKQILGANYATYLGKVYQTEGVDAFTNKELAVRQWGFEYMNKTGQYPVDLVPWCWDQVMCAIGAGINAGTFTDGTAFRQALADLPFDFPLSNQLKTPMYPQRDNKFFDETKQALMEIMVCKWSPEGCKLPVMYAAIDQEGNILSEEYPSQDLINQLLVEWHQRHPGT